MWKLKARTRKNIARKIKKEKTLQNDHSRLLTDLDPLPNELIHQPVYLSVDHTNVSWNGVRSCAQIKLGRSATILHIVRGSVVDFHGEAIVNAANEGCLSLSVVKHVLELRWRDQPREQCRLMM